ncbi:MOSC domain-containing protein [Dokdonella sp.]|uniref:MOSC domain-containing protein n=1 Tax=Dokdonella sp. TaxID=2291710 RepID=UPI003C3E62D1
MIPTLSAIHIYPVKSFAALNPEQALVEARGLVGDRRWMIVDADGSFVTARKHPSMVLVRAEFIDDGLQLSAPGMPEMHVLPAPQRARVSAMVWESKVSTLPASEEADAWISRYLGFPARFVHMDRECTRAIDSAYAPSGEEVSLADGFPLLLISQAALDGLNEKLGEPVDMRRFRPNLVVSGTPAHAEDGWRSIRIGGIRFDLVKACVRCVLTTVEPERGEFDATGEPLRTLIGYRRTVKGVTFGQNLIPRDSGRIRIGDSVEILD